MPAKKRKSTTPPEPTLSQRIWKEYSPDNEQGSKLAIVRQKRDNIIQWRDEVVQQQDDADHTEFEHEAVGDVPVTVSPLAAQLSSAASKSLADYARAFRTDYAPVQLSAQGYIPHTELYSGLWSNVSPFGLNILTLMLFRLTKA
jgi:hypothetical protein